MAIIEEILSTPVDINALRASGAPQKQLVDGAFTNFLYYAKKNWSYVASSKQGGEALLAGTARAVPCGGIAKAFTLVLTEGLGIAATGVGIETIPSYVWTGPTFLCFDPKVVGNLRKLNDRDYRNGCIFNEHYYVRCQGSYYDPCLSTAYRMKDESAKETFKGPKQVIVAGARSKLLVTPDGRTLILHMPNENVPGFTGAWVMFDATKKNLKKAMGSKAFDTELEVGLRRGTEFAKFVGTLV